MLKIDDLKSLKSELKIEDVMSYRVRLDDEGDYYLGECFLCGNQSLQVHKSIQQYKCTTCEASGDILMYLLTKYRIPSDSSCEILLTLRNCKNGMFGLNQGEK